MSDDFDDLPDDDLFTNPASLAAIEQAVASAEQHARTQGGNPSGNAGMQNRAGAVRGSHKYHHAMAPAGSLLRGRGGKRFPGCELLGYADEVTPYAVLFRQLTIRPTHS